MLDCALLVKQAVTAIYTSFTSSRWDILNGGLSPWKNCQRVSILPAKSDLLALNILIVNHNIHNISQPWCNFNSSSSFSSSSFKPAKPQMYKLTGAGPSPTPLSPRRPSCSKHSSARIKSTIIWSKHSPGVILSGLIRPMVLDPTIPRGYNLSLNCPKHPPFFLGRLSSIWAVGFLPACMEGGGSHIWLWEGSHQVNAKAIFEVSGQLF